MVTPDGSAAWALYGSFIADCARSEAAIAAAPLPFPRRFVFLLFLAPPAAAEACTTGKLPPKSFREDRSSDDRVSLTNEEAPDKSTVVVAARFRLLLCFFDVFFDVFFLAVVFFCLAVVFFFLEVLFLPLALLALLAAFFLVIFATGRRVLAFVVPLAPKCPRTCTLPEEKEAE
jgi:hypothetical protein